MTVTASALRGGRGDSASSTAYRNDIDGLRAIAVVLVVVYHVWFGRVSGGVDVFLMISAFFLTQSFVRRIERGQWLAIGAFLTGRFRRLLPAAAVTIAATLGAAWVIMPQAVWPQIWREGWASLTYVQNWVLAAEGVDYYARESQLPSPLQHFWSLSVQGQVFVLWPLILLCGALVARRTRFRLRAVLAVLFCVVFIASLAFSIFETAQSQSFAYFDTRTRLWEFAAGSLVALALPSIMLGPVVRGVLGWIGVAAIVTCGLVIDVRGGFPGYLALWPVLATALVIVSGHGEAVRWSVTGALGSRGMRLAGRDAYALYLVHWPILILWLTAEGRTQAGPVTGSMIILCSAALAWLIARFVERPLRRPFGQRGHSWRNLGIIAASVLVVVSVLVPWQITVRIQADAAKQLVADRAEMILNGTSAPADVPLVPQPIDMEQEWERLDESCTGDLEPEQGLLDLSFCMQTTNASQADHLIVVVGDSHAQQFTGALAPVAAQRGWGVVDILRGGCSLEAYPEGSEQDVACSRWQRGAIDYAKSLRPAAVFTVLTAAAEDSPEERLILGAQSVVDEFNAEGIPVIGVRDNPRSATDLYSCALERLDCTRTQAEVLAEVNPAIGMSGDLTLVDFTPWICPGGECRAEIGATSVYLDNNHLSRSFTAALAPVLSRDLEPLSARLVAMPTGSPSL
jgi:peptidoglycan/LPS O-acetylase OafA/YrhL